MIDVVHYFDNLGDVHEGITAAEAFIHRSLWKGYSTIEPVNMNAKSLDHI